MPDDIDNSIEDNKKQHSNHCRSPCTVVLYDFLVSCFYRNLFCFVLLSFVFPSNTERIEIHVETHACIAVYTLTV